jgi:hypothetical protein
MLKTIVVTTTLILFAPVVFGEETHPAVQSAMTYTLPENTCGSDAYIILDTETTPPSQASGSTSFFEGSSTASVSDVDGYARKRLERKEKRRQQCITKYKDGLLKDIDKLKGSAKHGLTQDQAQTILANMKMIQEVYMSKDGFLETAATP